MRFIDLTNKKFGRLKVISFAGKRKSQSIWLCKCSCGAFPKVALGHLQDGHTKSCGCLHKEGLVKRNFVHGLSKEERKLYKAWKSARGRCKNKKDDSYRHYGGRGIRFSDRWDSFKVFYKDMSASFYKHLEKYGERQTTLDRIDVNGDYKKENCRWATHKIQANNRRK